MIAGTPFLYEPYIVSAKYAAAYRNWHWLHERISSGNRSINISPAALPYPKKSVIIAHTAVYDTGGNFGRLARTRLMDPFKAALDARLLAGIPLQAWRRFLKVFTDNPTPQAINSLINTLERERRNANAILKTPGQIERFRRLLEDFDDLINCP